LPKKAALYTIPPPSKQCLTQVHPMDSLVSRHISIKSPAEQEKMRVAGRLAAEVLDMIG